MRSKMALKGSRIM